MSELPVWGIDLTAVSLRAVKLALTDSGGVRAEAWEVVDFTDDVEDVHALGRFDAFGRAVHSFLRHHDVGECRVIVSLRGEAAFARTVTVPQVNEQNLDKLLEYEAKQQIPYPEDDVYWDRRVISIRDGGDLVATVYAVKKFLVDDRIAKLQFAGMPVDGVQLRPIALQNFCARERLLDPGTVVVDVDYGGSQVLITHEDQTWFRCIPMGAFDFVSRLRAKLRVDHLTAVRLATGQARPRPQHVLALSEVRAEVTEAILSEVKQVIASYSRMHPGAKLTQGVLFEAHAATPPLGDALKAAFGFPFTKPKGFHQIEVDPDIVSAGIQENFAGLARAAGLALQGLGKADVAIRLYPETIPRSFKPRKFGYLVAAAAVVAMIGIAHQQHRGLRTEIGTATTEIKTLKDQLFKKNRRACEEDLAVDPLTGVTAKWLARVKHREGHLPWLDALLTELRQPLGQKREEATAPLLVSLEVGDVEGRVPEPHTGRVVLARVENAPAAELDQQLDAFMKGLVGKDGLTKAEPVDGWSCGALTSKPPSPPDERMLRYRFRHRSYALSWEAP